MSCFDTFLQKCFVQMCVTANKRGVVVSDKQVRDTDISDKFSQGMRTLLELEMGITHATNRILTPLLRASDGTG